MLVDFSNEFDAGLIEQRSDFFSKVLFVNAVDFSGNLEGNAGSIARSDCGIRSFLRGDAAKKGKVSAAGTEGEPEIMQREPVVNRGGEIRVWNGKSLTIRYRDQPHLVEAGINRFDVMKILPAMRCRQYP